jgi:hypothetical protein
VNRGGGVHRGCGLDGVVDGVVDGGGVAGPDGAGGDEPDDAEGDGDGVGEGDGEGVGDGDGRGGGLHGMPDQNTRTVWADGVPWSM